MPKRDPRVKAREVLRKAALAYPGAFEDHPWGECAIKVNGKIFVVMSFGTHGFTVSMKLPLSASAALGFPFTQPTGYGLGQHNWITATFPTLDDEVPVDLLIEWMDESFRAVAPKKYVAQLDAADS